MNDVVARTRKLAELAASLQHLPSTSKAADKITPGDTLAWADLACRVEKVWESATGNVVVWCNNGDEEFELELGRHESVPVLAR